MNEKTQYQERKLLTFFTDIKIKNIAEALGYHSDAVRKMVANTKPRPVRDKALPFIFKHTDTIMPTLIELGFDIGVLIPLAIQRGLDITKYVPDAKYQLYNQFDISDYQNVKKEDRTERFRKNRELLKYLAKYRLSFFAEKLHVELNYMTNISYSAKYPLPPRWNLVFFEIFKDYLLLAVDRGYRLEPFLDMAIEHGLKIENYVVIHYWYPIKQIKPAKKGIYITLPNYEVVEYDKEKEVFYKTNAETQTPKKVSGITHFCELPKAIYNKKLNL